MYTLQMFAETQPVLALFVKDPKFLQKRHEYVFVVIGRNNLEYCFNYMISCLFACS